MSVGRTKRLQDKVAIVTGASRGIGAAIALRLAAEGARVTLVARSLEPGGHRLPGSLEETAARIEALGGKCLCIAVDLADPAERSHIVPQTVERFGGVDILVHNAAARRYVGLSREQPIEHVRETLEVNVVAALDLAQQCVPSMRERGAGWIVNISSATVNHPSSTPYDPGERYFRYNAGHGPSIYAASKAALERLTTGFATELAADNIAMNTLAPVEVVATDNAMGLGVVDSGAHMEPLEAMAEAALELCSRPPAELSGRRVLSLDLLRELGSIVHTLDGSKPLPGYTLSSRDCSSSRGDLVLPARTIPVPKSISPEAQALLAAAVAQSRAEPLPSHERAPEVWRGLIEQYDSMILSMFAGWEDARELDTRVEVVGAVRVYVIAHPSAVDDACYLDVHGGGLISGGGEACRLMGCLTAATVGLRTYSPDYRMPPDHPYPAALDDCMAVYRKLVERYGADRVIVGGSSAGGNLAAALVLRARDEGLPMPAGLVLRTPELDLTESGDTFETLRNVDSVLPLPLMEANLLYAAGADLSSPCLSPLFGDFGKGFPRTFLQSGTRDLFLSNTVRMHRALRRAGVEAELHVFEAMPHGGFGGTPEDVELSEEVRRFVADCLRRT